MVGVKQGHLRLLPVYDLFFLVVVCDLLCPRRASRFRHEDSVACLPMVGMKQDHLQVLPVYGLFFFVDFETLCPRRAFQFH
jgi:hypothetical protein